MLQKPDLATRSPRRAQRTYTPQFKAELVAACQRPGASMAAIAKGHDISADVLRRWLKAHKQSDSGCQPGAASSPGAAVAASPTPAFIALMPPSVAMQDAAQCDIKVELRKGEVLMTVTWPISAAAELAQWAQAILR